VKKLSVLVSVVLTALAASACCILPLVLGVASAGTLGLSAALTPYRPYLIGVTLLLLCRAFYAAYRPTTASTCATEGDCAPDGRTSTGRSTRAMLWAITAFTLVIMAYPQIAAPRVRAQMSVVPPGPATAAVQTATFSVGKMDCEACSGQIVDALQKTTGVYDAQVSFGAKRAVVRYDSTRVSVPQLRSIIGSTGFPATEVTTLYRIQKRPRLRS
jgi:mercuric ion transport protein